MKVRYAIGLLLFSIVVINVLWTRNAPDEAKPTTGRPPQRVISTSPAVTEMIYALGAQDRLVGVTDFCVYPSEARALPKIGGIVKPSLETVIALRPDLVILDNLTAWMRPEFDSIHKNTLQLKTYTIDDILKSIRTLGARLNVRANADLLIDDLRRAIGEAKASGTIAPRTKVMMVVGRNPDTLSDIYVVGARVFLNDLIGFGGGTNIFDDLPLQYSKVSTEEIIARAPDIIIESAHNIESSQQMEERMFAAWQQLPSIPAVRNKAYFVLQEDYVLIPGPRFAKTLEMLKAIIQSEGL